MESAETQLFQRFGITRLADLTGLDRVGIPVWSAVRPGAWSLSQTQGKGLTHDRAKIGAVMEAAETALAEQAYRLVTETGTARDLAAMGHRVTDLNLALKCRHPVDAHDAVLGWLPGGEIMSGAPVLVPCDLVSLDFRVDHGSAHFKRSSIGLAAHDDRATATLSALLEAVEADAVALAHGWPGLLESSPAPGLAADPDLDDAVARLLSGGQRPVFRDLTSDLGLPVVFCHLQEAGKWHRAIASAGSACRFSLVEAALAAALEAAQSRLTDISGAREDIKASDYLHSQSPHLPDPGPGASLARQAGPQTTDAALALVLQRISEAGLPEPVAIDLDREDDGVTCVAVHCPGLEVGTTADGYRTGKRLRSRLLRHGLGLP